MTSKKYRSMCEFETPNFVYYSHIAVIILSLITGLLILSRNPKHPINRNAFYFILVFALWTVDDFLWWTVRDVKTNMFLARISVMADLIFPFFLFFSYHFTNTKITLKKKLFFFVPYFLLLVLAFTKYNFEFYDTRDCNYAHSAFIYAYLFFFEFFYSLWITYALAKNYRNTKDPVAAKLQIKILIPAIWFFVIWGIIYEEIDRISFLNNNYIDTTPHFIIGNLFFVSLIAFAIIKGNLFNFRSVLLDWVVIFLWTFLFAGFFIFATNPLVIIMSAIAYVILMFIFWKM